MTAALLRSLGQLLWGGLLVGMLAGAYVVVRDWRAR